MTSSAVSLDVMVEISIHSQYLEDNVGYSPTLLGEHMALQVIEYVRVNQLGYFPPFDYLEQNEAIDVDLLILMQELATYASHYAKREVRRFLSTFFASVKIRKLQSPFFVMPKTRLHSANVLPALAHHYSPNHVKMELTIICLQGQIEGQVDIEKYCADKAYQILAPHFDRTHIVYAHVLES